MKNKAKDFIKSLKAIFQYSVLWNISFPLIMGAFIDYAILDSRSIVIYLIWIPIINIFYVVFKKKILILIPYLLSLVFGCLDLIHWIGIKAPVSKSSMFVIFETSINEAKGFIDIKYSYLYIFIPIYLAISIFLLYKDFRSKIDFKQLYTSVIFLISFIFLGENFYNQRFLRKATPALIYSIVDFSNELKEYKKAAESIESFIGKINAISQDYVNEQITVVVIGESTNRNKMSLYGYENKTNPYLEKRKDIEVYTNTISPYTHTQASVRTCLTFSNISNEIPYTKAESIIDVARASDIETFWISNQAAIGVWDNLVALLAKTSENVEFVNKTLESRSSINFSSYDEIILKPFSTALKNKENKKLIILHLIGTHSTYNKRYPKRFSVFNYKDKKPMYSDYDNAVLYNDYVVNCIIDTLKKHSDENNSISSLVYFSDHGEVVYDDGLDYVGHDWTKLPSRHLVEIPFIVWSSPTYKSHFPKLDSIIKTNKPKGFCTDNLFHSLLDLMHIETDLHIDSLSIFHENYKENERFVVSNKFSYENEILKGKILK